MDVFDRETRSRIMRAIKSRNTKPEMLVHRMLESTGARSRHGSVALPGRPDFYVPAYPAAVFVEGCFFHKHMGCFKAPKTNKKFWAKKIKDNVARDRRNQAALYRIGIATLRIWECSVYRRRNEIMELLLCLTGG